MRNPDIVKRGQAAVDAVVGPNRLPNFGDEDKIPYIDALVMEGMRWRPVLPLGVFHQSWKQLNYDKFDLGTAHYTTSADVYKGYYIPAKTMIFGNTWSTFFR